MAAPLEPDAPMKAKPKSGEPVMPDAPGTPSTVKLSVNVSHAIGGRLRKIAFDERLSESSIVEIALELLFAESSDVHIGKFLHDRGASLRRVSREVAR
ncbi:MAG: hypothetical protein NVSMB19_06320 [Vulcanimicrobiaceae bacterium]